MSQPAAQGGIAVERGQFTEQLAGGGEQNSMTVDHRLMCEIAGQGGFTDAVWANQHGVGCVLEEVAQGFEAADMGALKAALEAAAGAFILFPADEGFRPAVGGGFGPMRQQAV